VICSGSSVYWVASQMIDEFHMCADLIAFHFEAAQFGKLISLAPRSARHGSGGTVRSHATSASTSWSLILAYQANAIGGFN
jgi:hypothetical protein